MCRDGMNMTFPDGDFGSPRCETGCPSGVFEYERPYQCVDACPPYLVLYNQSGRLLCGACDGYVYYDAARGMTRCLDYFACASQRMEPQIVREAGSPRRVCAEGALQTNYTVGDEVAEGVQRVAVYERGGVRLYCALKDRRVYVTEGGFGGRVAGTVDDVVSIGQHEAGVFLLDGAERLLTLEYSQGQISTHAVDSGVGYADGSADFILYVRRDGSVECSSGHGLCPPTGNLTGLVHRVVSANAEGITL